MLALFVTRGLPEELLADYDQWTAENRAHFGEFP
jgi:hypothetical protein